MRMPAGVWRCEEFLRTIKGSLLRVKKRCSRARLGLTALTIYAKLRGGEMPGKSLWVAVLFITILIAGAAAAQDEKNEIGGLIGRTFISDQGIKAAIPNPTIHHGKGLTFEGEYARRMWVTPVYSLSI